jgi:acetylornithine deacetylase
MKEANKLGLEPKFLIVGEPTKSKLITLQKGILKLNIVAQGIAAHSGYPETGKSAIEPLLDILQDLRKEAWPSNEIGKTTMNIGTIKGGAAANVVPEHAEANVMFRVISSPEDVSYCTFVRYLTCQDLSKSERNCWK